MPHINLYIQTPDQLGGLNIHSELVYKLIRHLENIFIATIILENEYDIKWQFKSVQVMRSKIFLCLGYEEKTQSLASVRALEHTPHH